MRLKQKTTKRTRLYFYMFILPWLIGFVLLTLGPMIYSLYISFTEWNMIGTPRFVGALNYVKMFTGDPDFYKSLLVTLEWAVYLPVGMILGLFFAVLLNQNIKGKSIFRTLLYIPTLVPAVATCMLWQWMFNYQYGMLNNLLAVFGISPLEWTNSAQSAIPSLILMSLWQLGSGMVIYLAALQGVDTALYESASLDGANKFTMFFKITFPLISPTLFFQLLMGIIGAIQVFTPAQLMTSGGPQKATLFYVYKIYRAAFVVRDMGYASALAWVLFLIGLMLTLLVFKTVGKKVYYET